MTRATASTRRRAFPALLLTVGLIVGLLSLPAFAQGEPQAGTIKVTGDEVADPPEEEPHVGCEFAVEFRGYPEGPAEIWLELQPPTGGPVVLYDDVEFSEEDQLGQDLNYVLPINVHEDLSGIFDVEPHPQQGWHVKITVHTYDTEDDRVGPEGAPTGQPPTDHKVIWIDCPPDEPVGPVEEIVIDLEKEWFDEDGEPVEAPETDVVTLTTEDDESINEGESINVEEGTEYDVTEELPDGFIEVDCDEVTDPGADVIATGTGDDFVADESGTHLVCNQAEDEFVEPGEEPMGWFTVTKEVTGETDLAPDEFDFTWECNGDSGDFTIEEDEPFTSPEFETGTECTVTEVETDASTDVTLEEGENPVVFVNHYEEEITDVTIVLDDEVVAVLDDARVLPDAIPAGDGGYLPSTNAGLLLLLLLTGIGVTLTGVRLSGGSERLR